jgi:hypothetical protein
VPCGSVAEAGAANTNDTAVSTIAVVVTIAQSAILNLTRHEAPCPSRRPPVKRLTPFIAMSPMPFGGQLGQGAPSMRSTVVVRRKPGMKCSITSEFTVPLVVSGRFLNPSK